MVEHWAQYHCTCKVWLISTKVLHNYKIHRLWTAVNGTELKAEEKKVTSEKEICSHCIKSLNSWQNSRLNRQKVPFSYWTAFRCISNPFPGCCLNERSELRSLWMLQLTYRNWCLNAINVSATARSKVRKVDLRVVEQFSSFCTKGAREENEAILFEC